MDKETYNLYHADYNRDRYRQRVLEALDILGNKCAKCGTTEGVLDIDHINPIEKEYEITTITRLSKDKFLKELAKCQLLCQSCHIEKTKLEQGVEHGGGLSGKRNCRCDLCRQIKNKYMREYKKNRRLKGPIA
jgi:5-methylcytosine-specific restriction endonuclease McrA